MAVIEESGITGMIITKGNMPTEEFLAVIRQIIREEIATALAGRDKTRGWQPVKPKEHK